MLTCTATYPKNKPRSHDLVHEHAGIAIDTLSSTIREPRFVIAPEKVYLQVADEAHGQRKIVEGGWHHQSRKLGSRCECDWPGESNHSGCRVTMGNQQAETISKNSASTTPQINTNWTESKGSLQQWDASIAAHRLQPLSLSLRHSRL